MTSEVKNKRKKVEEPSNGTSTGKFINHTFDDSTKAKFKVWAEQNSAAVGDLLDKLCDDGYNVSVKLDTRNEAYACFVIAASPDNPNFGYILTGRSHTPYMALLSAVYRHYAVFEGSWPVDHERKSIVDDE